MVVRLREIAILRTLETIEITHLSYLGDCVRPNVIESLSEGPAKSVAEGLMMAHLVSTLPIVLNAPNQYIEGLLGIGSKQPRRSVVDLKLVLFRTAVMAALLFLGETLPNFGAILDLIGGSTVTLLTFVFPPTFYLGLKFNGTILAQFCGHHF